MGLDLIAFKELKLIEGVIRDEKSGDWVNSTTGEIIEDCLTLYPNPHFPNHTHLKKASCRVREPKDNVSCCVGSYGYYGLWRRAIATMFGNQVDNPENFECPFKDVEGAPFNELLNFSGCEGLISDAYLNKIQQDFSNYIELAREQLNDYDFDTYLRVKELFDFAAPNGVVMFY